MDPGSRSDERSNLRDKDRPEVSAAPELKPCLHGKYRLESCISEPASIKIRAILFLHKASALSPGLACPGLNSSLAILEPALIRLRSFGPRKRRRCFFTPQALLRVAKAQGYRFVGSPAKLAVPSSWLKDFASLWVSLGLEDSASSWARRAVEVPFVFSDIFFCRG